MGWFWLSAEIFSLCSSYLKRFSPPTFLIFIQGFLMRAISDPLLRRQKGWGNSTKRTIPTTNTSHDVAKTESLVAVQEVRQTAIQRVRSATASPTTRVSTWKWSTVGELAHLWQMGTTLMLQVGCRLPFTTPLTQSLSHCYISLDTVRQCDTHRCNCVTLPRKLL